MKRVFLLYLLTFALLLTSCMVEQRQYVIGVSQCSKDSWREKLEAELVQATYFNEDVDLITCSADDDVNLQCRQIDSLISLGVDILVVSPQTDGKELSQAISHAAEKNIPVILFDRKIGVKDYAAFMGADNYEIGRMMGHYAASCLAGKGNIVEIGGEHGSSPAIERHRGFADALKEHPGLSIIGFEEGDWKESSGESAMEKILARLEKEDPGSTIDLVFGANDRMALGARKAIDRHQTTKQQNNQTTRQPNNQQPTTHNPQPIFLGIDALPTPGGGIEQVQEGLLTASAIYPTRGDELMDLALKILKGEPYEKNIDMETSIVTADNANVLLLQHKEVVNQDRYIKKMHARVDNILAMVNTQKLLILVFIFVVFVVSILLVISVRAYRMKHRLYEQLQQKNEELQREKGIVERQRDELEEQRDKLLDATTKDDDDAAAAPLDQATAPQSANEEMPKNEFMEKFLAIIDQSLSDSDLSVEDIGQQMYLSRVQLYRKVKALTGSTPVEIIREQRLKRAHILLADTSLSISEVAYRVGFSAPSYFAKCYKDFYGKSPSEK